MRVRAHVRRGTTVCNNARPRVVSLHRENDALSNAPTDVWRAHARCCVRPQLAVAENDEFASKRFSAAATAAVSRFLCSIVARAVFLESWALFREDRLTRSSLTSFTLLSSAAAAAAAAVAAASAAASAAVPAHDDGIDGRPCTQQQQGRDDAISALSPTAAAASATHSAITCTQTCSVTSDVTK